MLFRADALAGIIPANVNKRPATHAVRFQIRVSRPIRSSPLPVGPLSTSAPQVGTEPAAPGRLILIGVLRWPYDVVLQSNNGHLGFNLT